MSLRVDQVLPAKLGGQGLATCRPVDQVLPAKPGGQGLAELPM